MKLITKVSMHTTNLPEMNKALNEGGKLSDEDMATLRAKLEDYGKTLG